MINGREMLPLPLTGLNEGGTNSIANNQYYSRHHRLCNLNWNSLLWSMSILILIWLSLHALNVKSRAVLIAYILSFVDTNSTAQVYLISSACYGPKSLQQYPADLKQYKQDLGRQFVAVSNNSGLSEGIEAILFISRHIKTDIYIYIVICKPVSKSLITDFLSYIEN